MGNIRICHISDTHFMHKSVEIPECDLLIHSGDISPRGEKYALESFFKWFNAQEMATHRVYIVGNHDKSFDHKFDRENYADVWLPPLLEEYKHERTTYLENQLFDFWGIKIYGSPITSWFHGDHWAFNRHRGSDIKQEWDFIQPCDILVTHGPCYGRVDKVASGEHVGCVDLLHKIEEIKPLIHLSGHIHEAYGESKNNHNTSTHHFNGSICNLAYQPINKPWLMDVDFSAKTVKIL